MFDAVIFSRLAAFFPADSIGWKPQTFSKDGKKALAASYIDARDVMDRLDQVLGGNNWKDSYEEVRDHQGQILGVRCTLSVRCPGTEEWIAKQDIGNPSSQSDPGDRIKAAYSDALKRAAVKYGIGRYLYSMPTQWVEINEYKQFKHTPQVPAQFLPAKAKIENQTAAVVPTPISGVQAKELQDLCDKLEIRYSDVMEYYKVESFTHLNRDQYNFLKDHWETKLRKQAQGSNK